LTRRLIMDLVCIVIFETEYSTPSASILLLTRPSLMRVIAHWFTRYTRVTTSYPNFSGNRFIHLRLLRGNPFGTQGLSAW